MSNFWNVKRSLCSILKRAVNSDFLCYIVPKRKRMLYEQSRNCGPVVLVRNVNRARPSAELSNRASPLEVQSLDNEVKRLLSYIDVLTRRHENILEERDAEHRAAAAQLAAQNETASRSRREEYERTSSLKTSEIESLRVKLERLDNSEKTISRLTTEVEEMKRNGEEREIAWTTLLKSKEAQWSDRHLTESKENSALNERVELLVQSLETLQHTLSEMASEKLVMEEYIDSEPVRWKESTREMQNQLNEQRVSLEDIRRRNKSLESLLDDLQKEGALHDAASDERVELLKHELELEKRKSAEMVAMYCGQVENLHAQLEASMNKNRQLLSELQREKVARVQ
ncbi:Hypothetical protein, putative [Bodo saltans]|uniref:Uncharacterized protein n=1 Tax=Bodo saltans TaxID=75058 RepID=A0A0S4IV70_BODSA|nr:Hypothetical protein, putative [Bodo saltans]|eukprot:CUG15996.1 Hypothetical protein, putative [Bodo saltans]